jgi:hypothetical protein
MPAKTYQLEPGYAYVLTTAKKYWKQASDDDWEQELLSPEEAHKGFIVGGRRIDGAEVHVFRLADGRYVAQMAHGRGTRRTKRNHGNDPHSMTWGVMPPLAEFRKHLRDYYDHTTGERQSVKDGDPKGYVFYGELVGDDVDAAENAAVAGVNFRPAGHKTRFEVETVAALHKWIAALARQDDEASMGLASSMMTVLGYEWV